MAMSTNNKCQPWRTTLVPLNATIQEAIHSLEVSSMQIVLAVSEDFKLAGTLTDGDIRRALLKGLKLDSSLDEVMHRTPLVVPPGISNDLVLQLMQINRIHQLPVVDHEGIVVGLHVLDSIIAPAALENFMVIMAGGRGTRLRPHTENCPKPMLEIGGKPILEHIIEKARSEGFQNFLISLHYLGEMIQNHFGDGSRLGVKIDYLWEESPLGTAGGLSLMKRKPQMSFIVANGDVITDVRYKDILRFHERHNAYATMAVRQYEIKNPFGVVKIQGIDVEGFEEKPLYRSHINAGIYAINPDTLTYLEPNQHCDMPTLFDRIKQKSGRIIVYPMHEPWLDVGRPEDLAHSKRGGII